MTDPNALAAASSISTYLLARYGATMCSSNLAEQLHTTPTAIRIGLCRGLELPPPQKNLPGRGHRWLTVAVAEWLVGRTDRPQPTVAQASLPLRRVGRPRKGQGGRS